MPQVIRRVNFKLYPNKTQTKKLFEARRLHAYLYNAAISHRKTEYERFGRTVKYVQQQNMLPAFKKDWPEYKSLHSQSLQATLKRVDLGYNCFFLRLRKKPKFKSIHKYSGWSYPATSGWRVTTTGKHGNLTLNDLDITLRMRGKANVWGQPTTLTIVYKPGTNEWFASFTVEVAVPDRKYGSASSWEYEAIIAYDLGCETAITVYNGKEFEEINNPRFTQVLEPKLKKAAKALRRKRAPNKTKKTKGSRKWKKANKKVAKLQRKIGNQRKDWQHKVTSDLASRYDIGVTEKLEVKKMTRKPKKGSKRKKQKSGLNKSILSVGFSTLNKMLTYKIEAKGGLMIMLPTKEIKPSQRCPNCNSIHKDWADLSNRYHICECGFQEGRDKSAVMVLYNVATFQQPELGISFDSFGCSSSTSATRKNTGSMKQLGQRKKQKSQSKDNGDSETPSSITAG